VSTPASLSVAIVTYRTPAAMLSRALASLARAVHEARAAAALGAVDVLVIDNAESADDRAATLAGVRAWPSQAGTIEVLAGHGNVGYGRANNLVLGRLRSDVHLVMNPDVELEPGALAAGMLALEAHPDVGLAAPDVVDESGARQWLCKRYPSALVLLLRGFAPRALRAPFAKRLDDYEMRDVIGSAFVRGVPLASGAFMLVRTALFRALGGFDPRFFMYFEDYDLSLRVGREAAIAYVPDMRIVHHGGEASRKGVKHVAWFISSARRFFSRHGWKLI
jgi:GT2 family glycosyltransferase